jgi:UDP-N-acetylmuramoyl-tripeptide--D-alanyl-D-alanine ligase
MRTMETTFIALMVIACVSPILTLLRLWQIKEWRMDRLLEHVRREGWTRLLLGKIRPAVGIAWLVLWIIFIAVQGHQSDQDRYWLIGIALMLACISVVQIGLKKQPRPVWTSKAILLFVVSMLLSTAAIVWSTFLRIVDPSPRVALAVAMPYLAPLAVAAAWMILRPLDWYLKRRVLTRAMDMRRSHPHLTVIGITGSVGKTTTKELIAHLLRPLGALATPIHVNTEMGVAAWITKTLRDEPGDSKRILIVEMGAYRPGEIALLTSIAKPTIGVMTYVGAQHVALFGSMEAIIKTKGELLRSLPENGHAFLNKDNDAFDAFQGMCRCPVTSVGTDPHATIVGYDVEEVPEGIRFRALEESFTIPLQGTHLIANVLLAIAVAQHLGVPLKQIQESLRTFRPLGRTFEVIEMGGVTVLDDSYNSSPMSVQAAIDWAARQPQEEKILLAEGIIELGPEEAKIHRSIAEKAAKVFSRVFVADSHFLPYFTESSLGPRAQSTANATALKPGALLVCAGRVPRSTLNRFFTSPLPATR